MEINFNKLKEKDVIGLSSGKNIGRIEDIVFNESGDGVKSFLLTKRTKGFSFKKPETLEIFVKDIKLIGEDVILYNDAPEGDAGDALWGAGDVYSPKVFKVNGD